MKKWYVVYKAGGTRRKLEEELDRLGVEHYVPTVRKERLSEDGTQMLWVAEPAISNLLFVRTGEDIHTLVAELDCLRAPYKDHFTGKPATVADEEMMRFMEVARAQQENITILRDPFHKFASMPRVRVRAGKFEGLEGRVVRILRDRKLVISLGSMAVAISGIHHSLLEEC